MDWTSYMSNKKIVILFFGIVTVSIIVGTYNKNQRNALLNGDTSTTYAVFDKTVVFPNTGPVSYFHFKLGNIIFESDHIGRFKGLSKGDSVLIKYSVEDPNVFEVVDTLKNERYN